jgi:hypothetical protein
LRSSRSALSASSSSQACRSARRTDACSGFGSRSVTLRHRNRIQKSAIAGSFATSK